MVLGAYERWCGVDDAMMTWLMVPEVMEALHIRMDKKATEKNNLNYQVRCLESVLLNLRVSVWSFCWPEKACLRSF